MTATLEELQRENEDLRHRLGEAESIVRAIRRNEVDAFVVQEQGEDLVLVLGGVDRPYRLLIERMQQGAAILSPDGAIIYVNRRLAELLARPLPTFATTPFANYVGSANQASFQALLKKGRNGDAEQEVSMRCSDDTDFPALLNISPLLEQNGVLCLIVTDLTQQKRHELERERLAQEQSARTAAEQVAEVLRAADRRKNEFLAMLGHELRNPLAPLRNGLQILNLIGSREVACLEIREMMWRQLESLIRLVDDLLDVSRVTQGKIRLQKERTDLNPVIRRAVESCRTLIDDRGHHLELRLPEHPIWVDADLIRVTQVVTNLLNNAAKFTPRGGTIGLALETEPQAGQAVIRVRDNGRGIAPEMLATVFDLFAQVDPSVSRAEGGLGIGLTLSRRLVEIHGGSLEAFSAGLGQGSEFVVRLPLVAEKAEVRSVAAPAAKPTGGERLPARCILVVDDNRDSTETLTKLLRLLGHDVKEAFDGHQALTVMSTFVPDILLLDIGLPGMDGYEVVKHVRAEARLRNIVVVALSGYGGDEERRRSHAAGFDEHLVKPVDFAALQAFLSCLKAETGNHPTKR